MTDQERIARAFRAKQAYEEFFQPILDNLREEYRDRAEVVLLNELNPSAREGMAGTLAVALKVVKNMDKGLRAIITDGQDAEKRLVQAREIENLSEHKRRLLNIGPRY